MAGRVKPGESAGAQFPPLSASLVQLCGFGASICGYCHGSSSSSISYGLVSTHMLIEDYASLLQMGWRRSGTYFYKPTNHLTCCPAYTIRLRVSEFKPSKDQRRISRRFDRFLETGMVTTREDAPPDGVATDATMQMSSGAELTSHSLTVDTVPSEFTDERFELYKRYQTSVHNDAPDTVTAKGFCRFLVQSPLVASSPSSRTQGSSSSSGGGRSVGVSNSEQPLGTFHQLYRLDGNLIAVGVIDLLPVGFSSVYFFYDPDHRNLVLGKYSALREISYCRHNGIENYFMGYYIHSCEKMRYKAEFSPSELLCPTTHNWFPVKQCLSALNANTFTPLDPELAAARALIPPPPPLPPQKPEPEPTTAGMDCGGGLHHAGRGKEDQAAGRKPSKEKKNSAGEQPSSRDPDGVGDDDQEDDDENEDEDGEDGEEDGEGDGSEMAPNIIELHKASPLSRFTPVFPRCAAEGAALYASISLDLGLGVPVFVGQLKDKGQEIIRKMFDDLCMNCGPQMCSRMIVKLG